MNEILIRLRSPWIALLTGSILFLLFWGIAASDAAYINFRWNVVCIVGGNCSYMGNGPEARPPAVNWLGWEFIFLNPGLWFGLAFSFLYAPRVFSPLLPPLIIGLTGILGVMITGFPKWQAGFEFAGMVMLATPYAALGALIGFVLNRMSVRLIKT